MEDLNVAVFQDTVDKCLVRHRSILDVLSKFQESSARVNRSVVKAVTNCGCIKINAERQNFPQEASFLTLRDYMNSHLLGEACPNCREIIETEIGHTMFYLAAICNLMDLDLEEVMAKEGKRVNALGVFNLT